MGDIWRYTCMPGEDHVKTKKDRGHRRAKTAYKLPDARHIWHGTNFPSQLSEGTSPADTLILVSSAVRLCISVV
jgi:hypothetical protein